MLICDKLLPSPPFDLFYTSIILENYSALWYKIKNVIL